LKKFLKPLFILSLVYLAIGCIGTKHLKEGEYLLYNQKIKSSQKSIKENLDRQLVQKHNSRIWFLPIAPYTYVYYLGLNGYDTTKYEAKKVEITAKYAAKRASTDKESKLSRFRRKLNKKVGKENKKIDEGNLLMRWGEPIVVFDTLVHPLVEFADLLLEQLALHGLEVGKS
jgi:outer membrane protein insertion porin family